MIGKLIGKAAPWIVTAALLLCAAVFVDRAIARIAAEIAAARTEARKERDAYWTAEIVKSNAEVASARAEAAERVLNIEAETAIKIAEAEQEAEHAKLQNQALPGGDDIGLDAARVRLLPD